MDKKTIAILAATALLAACGRDQEPPPPPPQPPAAPPADAPAAPPPTMPPPTDSQTPPPSDTPMSPPSEPPGVPSGTGPHSGAPGVAPMAGADAARGESVYKNACAVCHAPGVAGAPRLEDRADWAPRIAQGADVLYSHAINGFQGQKGVMPPKGGNMGLSDQDVRAAVDYMVSSVR